MYSKNKPSKDITLYNIFFLLFNKESNYGELMRKFCFILHKMAQRQTVPLPVYPFICVSQLASPKQRIVKGIGKHKGRSSCKGNSGIVVNFAVILTA
jgi:cytochrome c oxidase assembly protein Cox11